MMTPSYPCWCGTHPAGLRGMVAQTRLMHCDACDTYRLDPPPVRTAADATTLYSDYYARATDDGDDVPAGDDRLGPRQSRFWSVVAATPELAQPRRAVADVGCGDGTLCAELSASGWREVSGFDVSTSRVRRCRTRYPSLTFYDRDIAAAGVRPGHFDLMVLDNVIEHVPDPLATVRQLAPFLADDGRLVLITPNMRSGHFRLLGRRWTPELAPHVHVFLFTPSGMARLIAEAGLRVRAAGSFHVPGATWAQWQRRLATADFKGLAWRAHQDLGGLYGRLIGQGPMLYVVAERAA
jgi:2-polyprenyl-3-methyl-5-hydroxy-6-metoxy-1,4-benzoquinol methylase